jgi:hypothetical protein
MSRTDVHAPYWVKERDPAWRRVFMPAHRHTICEHYDREGGHWLVRREVPCDLADFLAGSRTTHCGMVYVGGRNICCGCRLCTEQMWQKQDHRSERGRWRSIRQSLLRVPAEDRDDMDVPPL